MALDIQLIWFATRKPMLCFFGGNGLFLDFRPLGCLETSAI